MRMLKEKLNLIFLLKICSAFNNSLSPPFNHSHSSSLNHAHPNSFSHAHSRLDRLQLGFSSPALKVKKFHKVFIFYLKMVFNEIQKAFKSWLFTYICMYSWGMHVKIWCNRTFVQ